MVFSEPTKGKLFEVNKINSYSNGILYDIGFAEKYIKVKPHKLGDKVKSFGEVLNAAEKLRQIIKDKNQKRFNEEQRKINEKINAEKQEKRI